jgi:hypothetical protein
VRPDWRQRRYKPQGCLNEATMGRLFWERPKSAADGYTRLTAGTAAVVPGVGVAQNMSYDPINAGDAVCYCAGGPWSLPATR